MNVDIKRSFPRLKKYASFILQNHAEAFVRDYIQRLRDENLPLLTFVKDMSEEELFQSSLANTKKDFLEPVSEDKGLIAAQESAEKWKLYVKTTENPIDLSISDLIIAYQTRKLSLFKFLPLYEPFTFEMLKEIEDFSKDCEEITFETYDEITRNKIEENELFVKKVVEASPSILYVLDLKTNEATYLSKKAEEILGYTNEELTSIFKNQPDGILHPDDIESARKEYNEWIASGSGVMTMEYRVKDRQGEWHWIRNFQNIFKRDEQGNPLQIVANAMDITDLKNAKDNLKELNENLETRVKDQTEEIQKSYEQIKLIIESLPQLAWTADKNGNIDYYSSGWVSYLGTNFEELKKKGWNDAIFPEDQNNTREAWQHSLKTGEKYVVENRILRARDNMYRWHLSIGMPVKDTLGQIFKWVGTSTDIHERKTTNENLEKTINDRTAELLITNRELARSNNDLEQFAYVASHDLKEPLRMVNSYLQLLTKTFEGQLNDDQNEYLGFISSGAERMNVLIRDLLNYSRIIKDPTLLEKLETDGIIEIVSQNLAEIIEENHAVIRSHNLPVITGIESQQVQLFQNLIANAIKFKHSNRNPIIEITAHSEQHDWLFSVKDNGIGIAPQFLDRIYVIFQRLNSRSEYTGTGIGLSVCKKIIELYGGKIWCESTPGEGSTFFFTVPKTINGMEDLFEV